MIMSLAFWLVTSGILGARVFYIIEYWKQFQRPTPAGNAGARCSTFRKVGWSFTARCWPAARR